MKSRPDNPLQARAKQLGITMVERDRIPSSRRAHALWLATRLGVGDAQNRTPVIRGVVYVPGAPSGEARTTAPP